MRLMGFSGFRGMLAESDASVADIEEGAAKLRAVMGRSYEGFIDGLRGLLGDGKVLAAARAGRADGRPDDERIMFPRAPVAIAVSALTPTQREVDVDNSLAWQMGSQPGWQQLQDIVRGRGVVIKGPLLTLNGEYVVDGHHRWSQVYCVNPSATIMCLDIRTRDSVDPIDFLKAVQMAIAVTTRAIPQAQVRSRNLLSIDRAGFMDYARSGKGSLTGFGGMTDYFCQTIGAESREAAADEVWANVARMQSGNSPVSGAPSRSAMPQTDSVLGNATFRGVMSSGELNYEEPLTK